MDMSLSKLRAESEMLGRVTTPATFTLADRIEQAINEAQQRLKAARRAEELLKANPAIEELLNLLGRF